jgi:glycolate oxidase FAD binding subunit
MAVDLSTLASDLGSVCRTWRELDRNSDSPLMVDGMLPSLWCEPANADELAAVVGLADERGASVIPRGGGTRMSLGGPPRSADLLLSMRGLRRIVEYEPADLTVTVEAGIGFADLQRRLGEESQFLALDPPNSRQATIGGIVASNASGPLRLHYGSARDLVIGTRVANADGVLSKAGGRVVKNVAGYDLNKLYTGSLGTLGVIVELSFKLHPLPKHQDSVVAIFRAPEAAAQVVRRLMRSPLGPVAIEVANGQAAGLVQSGVTVPAGGCAMFVLVSGFERAVARVTSEIASLCREHGHTDELQGEPRHGQLWAAIRELADASDPRRPVLKMAVPPALAIPAFSQLQASLDRAGLSGALVCHAGVGLVYARLDETGWDAEALEQLAGVIVETRAFAMAQQGSLVVESAPTELKQRVDAWGEVGPSLRLMRALKEKLDPRGTLNPGRYVGGI